MRWRCSASTSRGTCSRTRCADEQTVNLLAQGLEKRSGPMTRLDDHVAVDDFLRGANFLSASGGGDPAEQRELLHDDLARGLELGWSPIDPGTDELLCTACFSGSVAPGTFDDSPVAWRSEEHTSDL